MLEPSRLASAPGTPVKQHSASSTGRLSSSAAGSPRCGLFLFKHIHNVMLECDPSSLQYFVWLKYWFAKLFLVLALHCVCQRISAFALSILAHHSVLCNGVLNQPCIHLPRSLGNLDDMYTRFITAPADIARARCSNSSASSDVADPIKAAHAEAAAAAADNPYAAFAGISEAGLQSSIFHAPVGF